MRASLRSLLACIALLAAPAMAAATTIEPPAPKPETFTTSGGTVLTSDQIAGAFGYSNFYALSANNKGMTFDQLVTAIQKGTGSIVSADNKTVLANETTSNPLLIRIPIPGESAVGYGKGIGGLGGLGSFVNSLGDTIPLSSLAIGGNGGAIQQAICQVVGWFTGPVGSAISTLAVIIFGLGALMGKVSYGMAFITGAGIATIAGAEEITTILGATGGGCGTNIFKWFPPL